MLFVSERIRRQLERERDLGPDVVPLADRLAVKVPDDDVDALIDYLAEHNGDANRIAWDLQRLFADDGFDPWRTLLAATGDSPNPRVNVIIRGRHDAGRSHNLDCRFRDAILAARWETFARERVPGDRLLIDIADDARAAGFEFSDELRAALDRLIDGAEAGRRSIPSGAELAAGMAETNRLLGEVIVAEFRAAQNKARDNPQWERNPELDIVGDCQGVPPAEIIGLFIEWANDNAEKDEFNKELETAMEQIPARAAALSQSVQRAFLPVDFIRDARGNVEPNNPDNVTFCSCR